MSTTNALVALTPDGKTLLTKTIPASGIPAKGDGPIRLWDVPTGKQRAAYLSDVLLYDSSPNVVLSPDGQLLVVICQEGVLVILELETGTRLAEIRFVEGDTQGLLTGLLSLFSPDSQRLVFLSRLKGKEFINVWDRRTNTSHILVERRYRNPAAITQDSQTLATCSLDDNKHQVPEFNSPLITKIELWDLGTGESQHSYFQDGWIFQAVFAPDERLVIITSKSEARLIDQRTGKILKDFPDVRSLAFFPGGRKFLTCGDFSPTIKCRDLATGTIQLEYRSHEFPELILPDGKSLVTRQRDGTVQFWNVPPQKPLWWLLVWTTFPGAFGLWQLSVLIRFGLQGKSSPTTFIPDATGDCKVDPMRTVI